MKGKFIFRTLVTSLFFSLILFLAAGKINYYQGWLFLVVNFISALMNLWSLRNKPDLITERMKPGEGAKSWDKKILLLSALLYLANVIVAGLDSGHFQWSPNLHWSVYLTGVILMLSGQVLFLAARNENNFFSSVIRIQDDRGHTVCETGPYKWVRHPGYLGVSISLLGVPLVTGSLWCLVTTIPCMALILVRTNLEDKTLMAELAGYSEYTKKVKHRLIPGIW